MTLITPYQGYYITFWSTSTIQIDISLANKNAKLHKNSSYLFSVYTTLNTSRFGVQCPQLNCIPPPSKKMLKNKGINSVLQDMNQGPSCSYPTTCLLNSKGSRGELKGHTIMMGLCLPSPICQSIELMPPFASGCRAAVIGRGVGKMCGFWSCCLILLTK